MGARLGFGGGQKICWPPVFGLWGGPWPEWPPPATAPVYLRPVQVLAAAAAPECAEAGLNRRPITGGQVQGRLRV